MNKSYFTIKELTYSKTAINRGIVNTPDKDVEANLLRLIEFLNPLREAWGKPIVVNSGYRCKELNRIVGGVATSAHLTGNAVDIRIQPGLKKFLIDYLKDKKFDQCIDENNWIHLGLFDNKGRQRRQIFKA